MKLCLPYPYRVEALLRDGRTAPMRRDGRILVEIGAIPASAAPVALRWEIPGAPGTWTHVRYGPSGHLAPLAAPGEDPRIACARLLREGWAEAPTLAPLPDLPALPDWDPAVERILGDDADARASAIRARGGALVLVGDEPYAACPEPVVVETGRGGAEIRPARGIDWVGAHPVTDIARDFPGAPKGLSLRHAHELLVPESVRIDRAQVTARVIRKALIVLRKACASNADARAGAARADACLASGMPLNAAREMALCLRALAPDAAAGSGLREFIARTQAYIGSHAHA